MVLRVLLAALLAGIAAGLIAGVIQHVRMTPLILQAEMFEPAGGGHQHGTADTTTKGTGAQSHDHGTADNWVPKNGAERTFFTLLTTALAGAGFAAVLAGISVLLAVPVTMANGFSWGMCGFLVFSLAPAAGLPPELPGMPAAELNARLMWWVLTVACTAVALWLALVQRAPWAIAVGIVLAVLPHIIGAPQVPNHQSGLSASLSSHFVASSLAINGLMWVMIGVFLGFALERAQKDSDT
jgi:cobalt transporter subunit CbtA